MSTVDTLRPVQWTDHLTSGVADVSWLRMSRGGRFIELLHVKSVEAVGLFVGQLDRVRLITAVVISTT